MVSRAYSFKQLCEKSDATLRQYLNGISLETVALQPQDCMEGVKANGLFSRNDVSLFNDIFNDATTHTLVEGFSVQEATGVWLQTGECV